MLLFAQQPIPDVTAGMFFVLMLACVMTLCFVAAWIYLANRASETKSILPRYEPRRPVLWTGVDVMAIVLFYLFIGLGIQGSLLLTKKFADKPVAERPKIEQPAVPQGQEVEKTTVHPLAQLLKNKDLKILLLCFAVGVVIVPIFEEFFFRLIFTGWLLALERRWRGKWRRFFYLPRAIIPINITSLVFASLHFRRESPEGEETNLVLSMAMLAAVSFLTMVFAIVLIAARHGDSSRDFGWDASKWREDLCTGAVAFFAVALPIYALQIGLEFVLPKGIAPDPISIYFFALVLGTLYFRTNRLLPSIVMHMLLNASSLAMAWALF